MFVMTLVPNHPRRLNGNNHHHQQIYLLKYTTMKCLTTNLSKYILYSNFMCFRRFPSLSIYKYNEVNFFILTSPYKRHTGGHDRHLQYVRFQW